VHIYGAMAPARGPHLYPHLLSISREPPGLRPCTPGSARVCTGDLDLNSISGSISAQASELLSVLAMRARMS
jgi:hypothetical protein